MHKQGLVIHAFALFFGVQLAWTALAETNDTRADAGADAPEPSRGTGLLVTGIVLASVSVSTGAAEYMAAQWTACGSPSAGNNFSGGTGDNNGPSCVDRRRRQKTQGLLLGGIGGVAGGGVIAAAVSQRHAWNAWKAAHSEQPKQKQAASHWFDVVPIYRGAAALWTYAY